MGERKRERHSKASQHTGRRANEVGGEHGLALARHQCMRGAEQVRRGQEGKEGT